MFRDYTKDEIEAIQNETGVKTVFSQNAKMKKSSQNGTHLYNWGIPAYKSQNGTITCPNASKCIIGCYAKSGAYVWSNVAKAYENRLSLSRTKGFQHVIVYHIDKLMSKHKTGTIMIRIHDSGDFYSQDYLAAWIEIANVYQNETRVQFYAYTKMVQLCKTYATNGLIPNNLTLIYSFGGRQDEMIQIETDRHSRVFENETELACHGYSDASQNDMVAIGPNNKVGLVYHGTKSYKNTAWNKVGVK